MADRKFGFRTRALHAGLLLEGVRWFGTPCVLEMRVV